MFNSALLSELNARMELWPQVTEIGDVIARMVPIMKVYSSYIKNYHVAQSKLKQCESSNKEFSAWLKK